MDAVLTAADRALRTLFGTPHATRACPTLPEGPDALDPAEARRSGALMRVNHVGEICAQALYTSQSLATQDSALRAHFASAARDKTKGQAEAQTGQPPGGPARRGTGLTGHRGAEA